MKYDIIVGNKTHDGFTYKAVDERLNVIKEVIASSGGEAINKFESMGIEISEFSKERLLRADRLIKAAHDWFNRK